MSQFLVVTLQNSLSQEIEFTNEERVEIAGFYPYIYFHNVEDATFTFKIERNSVTVFEQDFTADEIRDFSGDYAHIFLPIIPLHPVQIEKGVYNFSINANEGYQASETFIGWIKQYQDIQNEMSYTPINDTQNTFAIRFKRYIEGIRV